MEELVEVVPIRIKIVKCSFDKHWYKDRIGETFIVEDIRVRDFYVKRSEDGIVAGVLKIDAILVK